MFMKTFRREIIQEMDVEMVEKLIGNFFEIEKAELWYLC